MLKSEKLSAELEVELRKQVWQAISQAKTRVQTEERQRLMDLGARCALMALHSAEADPADKMEALRIYLNEGGYRTLKIGHRTIMPPTLPGV